MDLGEEYKGRKRKKFYSVFMSVFFRYVEGFKLLVLSMVSGLFNMFKEKYFIFKLYVLNNFNVFMEKFWFEIVVEIV